MSIQNIALLINPKINQRKQHELCKQIVTCLQNRSIRYQCFKDSWPPQINDFSEAWILGGDGTINYFLNYYKNIAIPIALFKGGTGNDFAWKLYGDCTLDEHLAKVLNAVPKPVDAALCNSRIFINGIGLGFDGEVLRSINTVRRIGGHIGYLFVVFKKIFTFRERQFTISFNGEIIQGKLLLLMITNSSRTGGGFMVSPEADIRDGVLNMVLCKPLSLVKRLLSLPVIEKGRHMHKSYIIHNLVTDVEIVCDRTIYGQLDGELIEEKKFMISVMPGRYMFKY